MNRKRLLLIFLSALSAMSFTACYKPEKKVGTELKEDSSAEVLSIHETHAVFEGVVFERCLGKTLRCPDKCGHSGEFARFRIKSYTRYARPGKYGDDEQRAYLIQISGFDKKPLVSTHEQDNLPELIKVINTLKEGDLVSLNWNHNYVTRVYPDGTSSSSPQRTVQKLEKLRK